MVQKKIIGCLTTLDQFVSYYVDCLMFYELEKSLEIFVCVNHSRIAVIFGLGRTFGLCRHPRFIQPTQHRGSFCEKNTRRQEGTYNTIYTNKRKRSKCSFKYKYQRTEM